MIDMKEIYDIGKEPQAKTQFTQHTAEQRPGDWTDVKQPPDVILDPFKPLPVPGGTSDATPYWQDPYQKPSWLGGAYLKTPMMAEESGIPIMQDWWRNPQWGGHVAWNPHWGFQDRPTVQGMYEEYAKSPEYGGQGMPWDVFTGLGLTEQAGPNWEQYFPQRPAIYAGQQQATQTPTGAPTTYQYPEGTMTNYQPMQPAEFPYPPEWNVASNTLSQFAQGLPTAVPPQWQTATDVATQAAQTGLPVDYTKWWEAQQPILQRTIGEQGMQAAEQAGLGGTRWGTPLQRQIADIAGRETQRTFADYMGMALGGEEAARGRQMGGIGALTGLGTGYAGLAEAAKNRGLTAGQSLLPLGQAYMQAPMDWARQMYGMGTQQQAISQGALDRIYQDFLRMTPESSPWLAQAMGLAGMQSQMVPQQYQPSFMSQLLGTAGSVLPFAFL